MMSIEANPPNSDDAPWIGRLLAGLAPNVFSAPTALPGCEQEVRDILEAGIRNMLTQLRALHDIPPGGLSQRKVQLLRKALQEAKDRAEKANNGHDTSAPVYSYERGKAVAYRHALNLLASVPDA